MLSDIISPPPVCNGNTYPRVVYEKKDKLHLYRFEIETDDGLIYAKGFQLSEDAFTPQNIELGFKWLFKCMWFTFHPPIKQEFPKE
jgi:hypothetical protein